MKYPTWDCPEGRALMARDLLDWALALGALCPVMTGAYLHDGYVVLEYDEGESVATVGGRTGQILFWMDCGGRRAIEEGRLAGVIPIVLTPAQYLEMLAFPVPLSY